MTSRMLGVALVLTVGCIAPGIERSEDVVQDRTETFDLLQDSPAPLDILFVVDNSAAMATFEEHVVANLPAFGSFFERGNGWWDRRIGVTTADVGCADRTAWRPAALTNGSFFIDWRHLDDTRTKNFEGTLEDHLPAALAAGHAGCGAHRPLDAIVAAIDPAAGFRRIEADLIIVILAAGDDQSENSIAETLAAVGEACVPTLNSRMRVIAIGPNDATRLGAFATELGFGTFLPITIPDLAATFPNDLVRFESWGVHCFESTKLDLDSAEGMQASCSVNDVLRDRDTLEMIYELPLPACTGANRPCWRIVERSTECGPSRYGIEVDRVDFRPPGTVTSGQCEILETSGE